MQNNNLKKVPENIQAIVIAFILFVATAVRLYKLGDASIWLDEAYTLQNSLSLDFLSWGLSGYAAIFFLIEHFFLQFGYDEFYLRLPSVIFGVLTIFVVYVATKRIGGFYAAISAAIILTFSFVNIEHSQEARYYQQLNFFLSLGFLGLIQLVQNKDSLNKAFSFINFLRSGALLFSLSLLLAVYTHLIAVFFWLGVQFFFLAYWAIDTRYNKKVFVSWTVVNVVMLMALFPLLMFSVATVSDAEQFSWLPHYSPLRAISKVGVVHSVSAIWGLKADVNNVLLALLNLPFVVLAFVGLYKIRRKLTIVVLMVSLLLCSSIVIWVFGYIKPVFMVRTILWGSLFSAMLIGLGISQFQPKKAMLLTAVLVLIGITNVYIYFDVNRAENEDWRAAAAAYQEKSQSDDILVFCRKDASKPFFFYVRERSAQWLILGWDRDIKTLKSGELLNPEIPLEVDWSDILTNIPLADARSSLNRQLWLVDSHCKDSDTSGFNKVASEAGWVKAEGGESSKYMFLGPVALYRYIMSEPD